MVWIGFQDIYVFLLTQITHQPVLLRNDFRPVELSGLGLYSEESVVTGLVIGFGGSQKRLGGYTTNVDTRPADHAGFDDPHAVAHLRRFDGRRHPGAARADHDQCKIRRCTIHSHLLFGR